MPGEEIRAVEMETMEVTPDRLMDLAAEADEKEMGLPLGPNNLQSIPMGDE